MDRISSDLLEQIWRDYNQRACVEHRIEELKSDLAADGFCLQEFFATKTTFLSILMLFKFLAEFQRASGMTGYRQPASLRVQVFLCGAILGRAGDRLVRRETPRLCRGGSQSLTDTAVRGWRAYHDANCRMRLAG